MTYRIYNANQIAKLFLSRTDEDDDISNLKLQKLCYYAQGLVSSMRGVPLFEDPVHAWDHGPVVPALYHQYKAHGSGAIAAPHDFDVEEIAARDRAALDDIYSFYGQFSAWKLREMTHKEKPWIEAYESADKTITVEDMVAFFRPQIDDRYVSRVYGQEEPV